MRSSLCMFLVSACDVFLHVVVHGVFSAKYSVEQNIKSRTLLEFVVRHGLLISEDMKHGGVTCLCACVIVIFIDLFPLFAVFRPFGLEVKREYYLNCIILAMCYLFNGHS